MADPLETCPQCEAALPSLVGKGGQCPACGTAIASRPALTVTKRAKPSATKPPADRKADVARNNREGDGAESRPPRSERNSEERDESRPRNPYLTPLLLLSGAYFPFLACVVLVSAGLGALVLSKWWPARLAIVLGGLLILTSVHIVVGLLALFQRVDEEDELEIELPDKWQRGLAKLVEQVASERGLDSPDVICLHAESLAHVYVDRGGNTVLAIGGTLIAMLPQKSLAGVIAHELSHLTAGDAKRLRTARHWHRVMLNLEARFLTHSWAVWSPLVWLIRLYHHVYFRLFFASQRREEFLADSYEVDLIGEEAAAATLVLIHVLEHMPWANLANMAEHMAMANFRVDYFFEEQVRRLRSAGKSDWEDALRQALREETQWYSTHPCLKDRLRPLGVKARAVLPLAMSRTGEPSTALFADWKAVEKHLSKKLLAIARVLYGERRQALEDYAAIMKTI
jgi:Zn-dependent protease with chaperone function